MTFKVDDRVLETSATTGTGSLNLAGAKTGRQTFVAGIGDGNTCPYMITDGTDWEVGIGTVTSGTPDQLSRDQVLSSSNGDAAVNWGSGSKDVACVSPASMFNGPAASVRSISSAATLTIKDNGHALVASASFTQDLPALADVFEGWGIWILASVENPVIIDPNSTEQISGLSTYVARGPCLVVAGPSQWEILLRPPQNTRSPVTTTSGREAAFTSIPDWATEIDLLLYNVSTNGGTDVMIVQLGDAGGYETTGYNGVVSNEAGSATILGSAGAGMPIIHATVAGAVWHGIVKLRRMSPASDVWCISGQMGRSDSAVLANSAGSKSLSGTLDRIKVLVSGSTDDFDAGQIGIQYR